MPNGIEVALRLSGGQAFSQGLRQAGTETASFAKSSGASAEQTGKFGSALRGFASDAARYAAGLASFAAAQQIVSTGFRAIETDVLSFDSSLTNSLSIVDNVTPQMRQAFDDVSTSVATNLNFSAARAADSLYFLASAGKSTQQSIAEMPAVAAFARAGMLDLADAADYTTQIQSAMGLGSKDLATDLGGVVRIQDVLTKTSIATNATIGNLADSLVAKGASAANRFGLSIEDVSALLGVFADQGIKGRRAGEAIDIVLREMGRGATENAAVWEQLGIHVFDTAGKFAGMPVILGQLEQALTGATDQQKFLLLSQLGFTAESTAYISSLIGRSQAVSTLTETLKTAGGATQEVADRQMQSLANRIGAAKQEVLAFAREELPKLIERLKDVGHEVQPTAEALLRLGVAVGHALEPFARLTLGGAVAALQGFNAALGAAARFMEQHRTLVALLAGVITTQLVGRALTSATTAVTAMAKSFDLAKTAGQGLAGGMGLLGLAITAGVVAYTMWQERGAKTRENIESLTKALEDNTKSVAENVDAWLAADVSDGGRNKELLKFGDFDTVSRAGQGDLEAQQQLAAAIKAQHDAMMSSGPAYEAAQYSGMSQAVIRADKALKELVVTTTAATDAAIANGLRSGEITNGAVNAVRARMAESGAILTQTEYLQALRDAQKDLNDEHAKAVTPNYSGQIAGLTLLGKGVAAVDGQFQGLAESADAMAKAAEEAVKRMDSAFTQLVGGPLAVVKAKIDFGDQIENFKKLAAEPKTTKEELDKAAIGIIESLNQINVANQKAGVAPEQAQADYNFGLGLMVDVTKSRVGEIEDAYNIDLTGLGLTIGNNYGESVIRGALATLAGGRERIVAGLYLVGDVPIDVVDGSAPKSRAAGAAMVDSVSDGIAANGAKAKSVFDEHVSRPIWNGLVDDATGAGRAAGEALGAVMAGLSDYIPKTPSNMLTAMFGATGQFGTVVNQARQFSQYVREGMAAITNSPTGARLFDASGVGAADTNAQITAYNSAVESMAQTYADLAQATDQATADMLVSQGLAADEFDRTARAIVQSISDERRAQEELQRTREENLATTRSVEDAMFHVGELSTTQYLGVLQRRLDGLHRYSTEWLATWDQIQDLTQKAAAASIPAGNSLFPKTVSLVDNQFAAGMIDRNAYLKELALRMAELEMSGQKYSDEWFAILAKSNGVLKDIADEAKQTADDMAQAQQDALDKAARAQQDAAQAVADAWNAVAAPILKAGSLVDAFSGQLSVSGGTIQSFMGHQVEAAHRWADALHDLQAAGLDPRILADLAKQGPQSLGTATGLLSLGASGISGINSQYQDIAGVAGSLGSWASGSGGVGGIVLNGGINLQINSADGTVTMADVTTAIVQAFGTLQDMILIGASR